MRLALTNSGTILCAVALACTTAACGERPGAKKADAVTPADVIAGAAKSLDHYESAEGKFAVDFPPVWKGNYTAVARNDTTYGERGLVDFRFSPDSGWKVEPATLLVIRVFTPDSWAKTAARPGPTIGVKLAERANNVFVLSLAGGNPYKAGTPPAALFDQMMLAVINDSAPLRVTPR